MPGFHRSLAAMWFRHLDGRGLVQGDEDRGVQRPVERRRGREGAPSVRAPRGRVDPVSEAADLLEFQLKATKVPYVREEVFARPRRFRFDFRLSNDLAVEVDGGGWINGRHSRGSGMLTDCEKTALAAAQGIRVMRVMPEHVQDGRALKWIEAALAFRR